MHRYTIYRTPNLPNTYLVCEADVAPRKIVPFNLIYLAGDPEATKADISPSYFPFAAGSRKAIVDCVEQSGYCFYRWPGKVLGAELGDVLELPAEGENDDNPSDKDSPSDQDEDSAAPVGF